MHVGEEFGPGCQCRREKGLQKAGRLRAKGELSLKYQAGSLTTFPPKPRNIKPKFCRVSDVSTRM